MGAKTGAERMAERLDFLIRNATVIDGTGRPAFQADVGIHGERIAVVGTVSGQAAETIDGTGLVVCPGFIDGHSHADLTIADCPAAENLVMQGITTFVGGNCGSSLAPVVDRGYFEQVQKAWGLHLKERWMTFAEWLDSLETTPVSVNIVTLVGHNAIRGAVLGTAYNRVATEEEVGRMRLLLSEALRSGAFGMSAGLDANMPGHFAGREELVSLVRLAGEHGALFTPHTRHHQNQWFSEDIADNAYGLYQGSRGEIIAGRYHGLLESLEICRAAGQRRVLIAHLTPAYLVPQPHPEALDRALAEATLADIVDRPRAEGLDVFFNVVGWEHSIGSRQGMLAALLEPLLSRPAWLAAIGPDELPGRLRDGGFRERLRGHLLSGRYKFGMLNPVTDPYWMDCYRVLECRTAGFAGRTIGEIARERSPDDIIRAVYVESVEVVFDILTGDPRATWALVADKREHRMLDTFLRHPAAMPISDVTALPAGSDARGVFIYGVSPTAYGLFPQYLRRYAREKPTLSLEDAIHRITGLPAKLFGIPRRGTIEEGAYADLVLLDFERLQEGSDYLHPARPPAGIERVLVNGQTVWQGGRHTGRKPGRLLRKS
jgi:N-acyl-D-amino-acid deacylase